MSRLRAAHADDPDSKLGVDVLLGTTGDMDSLGIYECFRVRWLLKLGVY